MPHTNTLTAIAAAVAGRIVRITGGVAAGLLLLLFLLVFVLVHNVSPWWSILFVPLVLVSLVTAVIFWVAGQVVGRLYPKNLSREQRKQLVAFGNKTITFARSHAGSLSLIGVSLVKDVVIHRNLGPVTELIQNSSELYKDYQALALLLGTSPQPGSR